MMLVTGGSTDVTTYFQMRLTAGGDGTGLTIADFDLTYTRSGDTPSAKVDAVALAAANTAHTDNRGIEVDPTDAPGLYRFDWPDAAFAAGAREVILTVKHTSCFTESLRVEIDGEVSITEWNGVKLATTNPLPNAAADAAGGLPISDAGGLDMDAIAADLPIRVTKNVALANFPFKLVDATDGYTAETGLTPTCQRSIDGAAFGSCANAAVEISNGWYKISLDASDLNGDTIILRFTDAAARETSFVIVTQPT